MSEARRNDDLGDLLVEIPAMVVAAIVCVGATLLVEPAHWAASLVASSLAVIIFSLVSAWLIRAMARSQVKDTPKIWLQSTAVRFLSVPAIGLALILGFGWNPVASLLPPLVVYVVALGLEVRSARRRLFGEETGDPSNSAQDSASMEAST